MISARRQPIHRSRVGSANLRCVKRFGSSGGHPTGKVRKEHIASLGSVETPLTAGRVAFWQQLNGRLARLDNRSYMPSHGVGLRDVSRHMHGFDRERDEQAAATSSGGDLQAAS
jgi:hypothetical protein